MESAIDYLRKSANSASHYLPKIVLLLAAFPLILLLGISSKFLLNYVNLTHEFVNFRVGNQALTGEVKTGELLEVSLIVLLLMFVLQLSDRPLFEKSDSKISIQNLVFLQFLITLPFYSQIFFGGAKPLLNFSETFLLLLISIQLSIFFGFLGLKSQTNIESSMELSFRKLTYKLLPSAFAPVSTLGAIQALRYVYQPRTFPPIFLIVIYIFFTLAISFFYQRYFQTESSNEFRNLNVMLLFEALMTLPLVLPTLYINTQFKNPLKINILESSEVKTYLLPHLNWHYWILAIGIIVFLVIFEFVIYESFNKKSDRPHIPSLIIVLLVAPFQYGFYSLPKISTDDYHSGENFAASFLTYNHNQIPYIDYFPIRGIIPTVFPGVINEILNFGAIGTLNFILPLVAIPIMYFSHLLLKRAVGFELATLMIFLLGGAGFLQEGQLLSVSILIFSLQLFIRKNAPIHMGLILFFGTCLSIFSYPMFGLANAITIAFLLIVNTIHAIWYSDKKLAFYYLKIISTILFLILLIINTILGEMLLGAINYVISNASGNDEAHGVALDLSFKNVPFTSAQLIAMSFLLSFPVTAYLFRNSKKLIDNSGVDEFLWKSISFVPAIYAIILAKRFLGRVDPSSWLARTTGGSQLFLGLILPAVIVILTSKIRLKVVTPLLALGFVITMVYAPIGSNFIGTVLLPKETQISWNTASIVQSMPKLGIANGEEAHLNYLNEIAETEKFLPSGEPVLNLTNKTTFYGYFDWTTPFKYFAPYNIESAKAEINVIQNLKKNKPDYAITYPAINHDGVSLSLRNPQLATWLMENYFPIACGNTQWAILNTVSNFKTSGLLNCNSSTTSDLKENIRMWSVSIGAPQDMGVIPSTWGKSLNFQSLPGRIIEFQNNSFGETQGQMLSAEFIKDSRITSRNNLLFIEAKCKVSDPTRIKGEVGRISTAEISWAENSDFSASSIFKWGEGNFLIPLDGYPSWVLDYPSKIQFKLKLPAEGCTGIWEIKSKILERGSL